MSLWLQTPGDTFSGDEAHMYSGMVKHDLYTWIWMSWIHGGVRPDQLKQGLLCENEKQWQTTRSLCETKGENQYSLGIVFEAIWNPERWISIGMNAKLSMIIESFFIRKPVYAIYGRQRHRSACASLSLISVYIVRCWESMISVGFVLKIPGLLLALVAEQASLSLARSERLKKGFLVT